MADFLMLDVPLAWYLLGCGVANNTLKVLVATGSGGH